MGAEAGLRRCVYVGVGAMCAHMNIASSFPVPGPCHFLTTWPYLKREREKCPYACFDDAALKGIAYSPSPDRQEHNLGPRNPLLDF